VCHPGLPKASNDDLKSVRVKKSFRNDEIGDSMAGSRFVNRIRPDAPQLWRGQTQNRENNPMQSRMAREKRLDAAT
jgi:hypothetical protein